MLRDDTYVARPPSPPEASGPPLGAATAALGRLAAALADGDPGAARALAPDGRGRPLAEVADNARRLRVAGVSFRYVDEVSPTDDRGRWTAAVETTWRYAGVEAGTARAEVNVRLVDAGARVDVLGFREPAGEASRMPVWLAGPVSRARSGEVLVVTAAGVPAERYRRTARRALPQVRRVLPDWRGPLVVEVPPDSAGVADAVAAEASTYESVAAVTATADGSEDPAAPVRVFVNPDVFGDLGDRGAQVVMTHEAVHVATGATGAGPRAALPEWLREGFADYVALRDVDLPVERTAAQAIELVRQDGLPATLPDEDQFDATGDQFGAAYEASWLACRVVADVGGEEALVGLYDDVASGRGLETALRERAGIGVGELTRRWRSVLSGLAEDGPA